MKKNAFRNVVVDITAWQQRYFQQYHLAQPMLQHALPAPRFA